jgi:hypothetical protein
MNMQLAPNVQKLNKKDAEICKLFKAIVAKGKFEIQGEALAQAGAFFQWFNQLEAKILETIKEPPAPPAMKMLEPVKVEEVKPEAKPSKKGK